MKKFTLFVLLILLIAACGPATYEEELEAIKRAVQGEK